MKLRTIVKIAVTSSVVLLCAGFALYSFFRLSATENQKDFNLYTLVPPSASAVFATDDAVELIREVDELACGENQQFLHVSRLFAFLKQNLNKIQEDAPHGLSRRMNRLLISFHEPDDNLNQVLYCSLGGGDQALIEKFVQKYTSSGYPARTFNYRGEKIHIYPMADGDFLSCYVTSDYMALSHQKKLIEEVIDADKSGKSLAADAEFAKVCGPKKSPVAATVYTRLQGVMGWTEYEMKLKNEFIYFSGVSHAADSSFVFINTLRQQGAVSGFPGDILPSTAFYFTKQGVSDWASLLAFAEKRTFATAGASPEDIGRDKSFSGYLAENTGQDMITCLFQREDSLLGAAAVMSLSVADVTEAERMLRSCIDSAPAEGGFGKKPAVTFCDTFNKSYPIYTLPYSGLFSRLTGFSAPVSAVYAAFYGGRLLLAPDADGVSSYIRQLDAGNVLDSVMAYQAGTDGLSDTYHLMLMADFERIFRQPENYVRLIPDFFVRNSAFFREFILFAQFSCVDGMVYPNIVLKYKNP